MRAHTHYLATDNTTVPLPTQLQACLVWVEEGRKKKLLATAPPPPTFQGGNRTIPRPQTYIVAWILIISLVFIICRLQAGIWSTPLPAHTRQSPIRNNAPVIFFQRLLLAEGDKMACRRAYSNLGNAHVYLGKYNTASQCYM